MTALPSPNSTQKWSIRCEISAWSPGGKLRAFPSRISPWDSPKEWLDNSEATAVAVTADGDIYVAGNLTVNNLHSDVFVWQHPANAMPTWATWDSDEAPVPDDRAHSILVSTDGKVFVGGASRFDVPNFGDQPRMSVTEYSDASLTLRWADLTENDHESSILGLAALDGDIAIAGTRREQPDIPYTFEVRRVRIDDGDEATSTLWTYSDSGVDDRLAVGIELDPNGRLAITGTIADNPDKVLTVVLDPDGKLSWSETYQNFAGGNASASAIAVDPLGYSYFVGTLAVDDGFRTLVGKRNP